MSPSTIKRSTVEQLKSNFGRRATDSPLDRELYSRDLAPVPAPLVKPFFQTLPDLIIRPQNAAEISTILAQAHRETIAVTPRASGSTVFFNAVPVQGGLVLDLGLLEGVHGLDKDSLTVTVGPATTWLDLETYLNREGLGCKSMPSSAPSASVGGWLSMMGYGIGSLKYGDMAGQVSSIEVVLPDGTIHRATKKSDPPLDWFCGAEGTLGIITEIELEIRPLSSMRHLLMHVADRRDVGGVMSHLAAMSPTPYNVHLSDSSFLRKMKELGFSEQTIESGCLLAVDFEGSDSDLHTAENEIALLRNSFTSISMPPQQTAREEWNERFRSIRLKRGGPSMLGAEVWLPISHAEAYLEEIDKVSKTYGLALMSYGHIVSQEHATVMTMFFSDETKLVPYLLDLSIVKKVQDVGYKLGGTPYGVGLWNTPYLGRIYAKSELQRIRERKRKLDPKGIMNPGKVYKPPFVLSPPIFNIGMEVAAFVRRFSHAGK